MSYATAAQYIERFGSEETAQLLSDQPPYLTTIQLDAAIAGTLDSDADIAANQTKALTRLNTMLTDASQIMDGYMSRTQSLPLSQTIIADNPLIVCCVELARCQVMDQPDNHTELADNRCKRWYQWLRDIAAGKAKLVDKAKPASAGSDTRHGSYGSQYDWGSYPSMSRGRGVR